MWLEGDGNIDDLVMKSMNVDYSLVLHYVLLPFKI